MKNIHAAKTLTTPLRRILLMTTLLTTAQPPLAAAAASIPSDLQPHEIASTTAEPITPGPFQPTWKSLEQYKVPDWFRDAKFGIWAHWGPQCEPEAGDWYARRMYEPGDRRNKIHAEKYGDPVKFGFKDVINKWKAAKWDPAKLVALYKHVGAQYFFAMANHHDNLDLYDSKHQPWNSITVGPKKDIIKGWAEAARAQGLPFGVSVHAAHAPLFYQTAQAYDGLLAKSDGKGTWWEGLDPQLLYAQSRKVESPGNTHKQWNWGNGAVQPDAAFCQQFYDRTADLIKKYQPDLIYFDDTALPLWPVSDAGLKIAADFYNTNLQKTGGKSAGVLFGKNLDEYQRKCFVWDIERGQANTIEPLPWQTDTCIGGWHYDRETYEQDHYKKAPMVIRMLADIVSKNGNLLLSIPVRADGSIDEKEENILEDIGRWMEINKESILGTRPWKIFGEGPASEGAALSAQGFNEGKGKPFTWEDVRFTAGKDGSLYVIALGWPKQALTIRALASIPGTPKIKDVTLLGGSGNLDWKQTTDGLVIQPPATRIDPDWAPVFKITLTP